MNPILILTHNNLSLTKKAIDSCFKQSLLVRPWIIDNGSSDGTIEWAEESHILYDASPLNNGVSKGWNHGLERLFGEGANYVLVGGNDIILPTWSYEELLSYDVPFVTGTAVNNLDLLKEPAPREMLQPAPDFSLFLMRREIWNRVGSFDEGMVHYASDVDLHIRAVRAGIPLWKSNMRYYHEGSSTLRYAPQQERAEIEHQADLDRAFFERKWGFKVGSPAHHAAVGFSSEIKSA